MIQLFSLIALTLLGLVQSQTTQAPNYGPYPPNTTICFDEYVGCFSNIPPFTNAGNFLPVAPDILKTEFLLYTRNNYEEEQFLNYNDFDSIKNSNFNPKLPLKMIIHGFSNNRSTPWIHEIKREILNQENVNILVVAWGNGSAFPLYNNATANIRLVGKQTGLVINDIRTVFYSANPASFQTHCIGHSLGAHACGYASRASTIPFNRISAMDPAGPLFEDMDPLVRVDPTDSFFVDAYHTNGGTLLTAAFGILMPSGHVDFYINGGKFQPGCPGLTSIIGGIIGGSGSDPTKEAGCSHNRIMQLYKESISSHCGFLAFNCPSEDMFYRGECVSCAGNKCSQIGYHADNYKGRGTMYLLTNAEVPYCGYHHSLEMEISSTSPKTKGDIVISIDAETNNQNRTLLSGEDINPSTKIRKLFVTEHDLYDLKSINIGYVKKSKPIFGSDYSTTIKFDKVKVTNIEIDEIFSRCLPGQVLNDKQPLTVNLEEDECTLRNINNE